MRHQRFNEENINEAEFRTDDFQNWLPLFQRLGLKPRRYFRDQEAVYIGTAEGWFRLSLKKYDKYELKWLRSILEYLNERSFNNWAVPWQKTIIWEENTFCYLIQPWLLPKDYFQASDPASVSRIAEIMAEFYNCGKDYHETRGIEILRDRWQNVDLEWELALNKLEQFKNNLEHEKLRKEIDELRKIATNTLIDCLTIWKKSGLGALLEHHRQSGILGHGNLLVKNIIWGGNDYYLLNWEGLAFQPRVTDIASLINDVAWWETGWILFLLHEYSKILPFWPEEYSALLAMLKYPKKIIDLFTEEVTEEELDRKNLKEVARELARKERCLLKVWKELGSQKRWAWSREAETPSDQGKMSMVLSPVESWGDFAGQVDSLIQVKHEQKLPTDVIERLSCPNPDRVVAGRDGNILESATKIENNYNENHFIEIVEPQPKIPEEKDQEQSEEGNRLEKEVIKEIKVSQLELAQEIKESVTEINEKGTTAQVLRWASFPKPVREKNKFGH